MKTPIKWTGGKTRILPEILKHFPATCTWYVEPFLGGASVFLGQTMKIGRYAILNDLNTDLIVAYRWLRDGFDSVKATLESGDFPFNAAAYARIRAENYQGVHQAARFLYLNRTAFNGLWRVNRKGQFNVPYGHYAKPAFPWVGLKNMSVKLADQALVNGSYHDVLADTYLPWGEDVVIYLDPPYDPLTVTSDFTGYTACGWDGSSSEELATLAIKRAKDGAKVIASNHDTPRVRALYGTEHFDFHEIKARRSISANAASRKEVKELVIVSKDKAVPPRG